MSRIKCIREDAYLDNFRFAYIAFFIGKMFCKNNANVESCIEAFVGLVFDASYWNLNFLVITLNVKLEYLFSKIVIAGFADLPILIRVLHF